LVGSNYSQLELHVIPELLVEQGLTDSSCPQWELCSVPALALHHWGLVGSNYSQEELYLIPEVPADGWGFVHANCARLELCLVPEVFVDGWGLVSPNCARPERCLVPEVFVDGWGLVSPSCARPEWCLVPDVPVGGLEVLRPSSWQVMFFVPGVLPGSFGLVIPSSLCSVARSVVQMEDFVLGVDCSLKAGDSDVYAVGVALGGYTYFCQAGLYNPVVQTGDSGSVGAIDLQQLAHFGSVVYLDGVGLLQASCSCLVEHVGPVEHVYGFGLLRPSCLLQAECFDPVVQVAGFGFLQASCML